MAGIDGVGVEDVDDEVVESDAVEVVEIDAVVTCTDEVLVAEPVVELVEATDREYIFSPKLPPQISAELAAHVMSHRPSVAGTPVEAIVFEQ